MQSAEEGDFVMVKLSDGEDVFAGLQDAATAHRVQSGAILWGIGMLQDFEIGFYGPAGYERRAIRDRHELIAFHGSITMQSDPKFHIHVAVGQRDHVVIGGHLFRAKACMVNEICLARFAAIQLDRTPNPATELPELQVSGGSGR